MSLGLVLGLIVNWAMSFHETGYFMLVFSGLPDSELLAQTNCTVNALGTVLAGAAVMTIGRFAPAAVRSWLGFLGSRRSMLFAGVSLTLLFYGACRGQWIGAVLCLELVSSACGTLLVLSCLYPLLDRPIDEVSRVCSIAVALRALYAGVLVPGASKIAPGAAPCALQLATVFVLAAFLRYGCHDSFAFRNGNLRLAIREKTLSPLPVPQELAVHMAAYFYVLGMMHIFISIITQNPILSNGVRGAGFLAAAAVLLLIFGARRKVNFPWPYVRNVAFPLTMLTFLSLPLTIIASDAPVFIVPIFFTQIAESFYMVFALLLIVYVAREAGKAGYALLLKCTTLGGAATGAGVVAGSLIIDTVHLDSMLVLCVLTIGAFLLLCLGTFWVGDDILARKAWGLRAKKSARKFHDESCVARVQALSEQYGLTRREREVLLMLANGKRPSQIADEMVVTVNTVRSHIRSIYSKLSLHSASELAALLENRQNG